LRTIQFPWYTSLSLKTKKPDSPVISVNIGQNTTARVYVSSLHYIFNEYFNYTAVNNFVKNWFIPVFLKFFFLKTEKNTSIFSLFTF